MVLFVCCPEGKELLKFRLATESLPRELLSVELFHCLESFFLRLRHPVPPGAAALVVVGGADDLRSLLAMKDFLWNIRLVLTVPDENPDILLPARQLSPRYIGFEDGDFSDVAAVLKKMAQQQER